MKPLTATVVGTLALVANSAWGQGSILFQNVGPGLNAQIRDVTGALIPAGNAFTAELLAGTTSGNVAAFATPITSTAWAGNGWFGVGQPEKVLPGFAPGTSPFFQVRIWDNAGGTITSYAAAIAAGRQYGQTIVWQLGATLGNPTPPPTPGPALIGMTGLGPLIPEPSTVLLGALGASALLLRRRK